jgi:hypothetical protein
MLLIPLFAGATRLQMGLWQVITPKLSPQTPARESFRVATAKIVTRFTNGQQAARVAHRSADWQKQAQFLNLAPLWGDFQAATRAYLSCESAVRLIQTLIVLRIDASNCRG